MSTLSDTLAAIVAPDALCTTEACAPYAIQTCVPQAVVAPETVEQMAAVMHAAHAAGAAVAPWGGGTQQAIGNPPNRLDVVVRTERLNRVLIHEPADLTISVEAGMTLGALQRYLAGHNQMLPLDPPLADQATIGGLIATAADGPRRLGYGTLRDLLIGITVVEATGRISKAGGMVVKNVSGFDMMKLYLGSFGTLAIVVAANFKLLPAPRVSALLFCAFARPADAFAMLGALHASQLTPASAEYLNGGALAALGILSAACAIAIIAEGLPQAVERHTREIGTLTHQYNGTIEIAERADALRLAIANVPQTAHLAPDEAVLKFATLPSELASALELLSTRAPNAIISARALDGVAYARLPNQRTAQLTATIAALPGVQWVATALDGVPRWGALPEGGAMMRRIKAEFDPQAVLNPGRFAV